MEMIYHTRKKNSLALSLSRSRSRSLTLVPVIFLHNGSYEDAL